MQRAIDVAFKYRNYFRKDIIVDLIVYRRWCVPFSSPLYSPFPPPAPFLVLASSFWFDLITRRIFGFRR